MIHDYDHFQSTMSRNRTIYDRRLAAGSGVQDARGSLDPWVLQPWPEGYHQEFSSLHKEEMIYIDIYNSLGIQPSARVYTCLYVTVYPDWCFESERCWLFIL